MKTELEVRLEIRVEFLEKENKRLKEEVWKEINNAQYFNETKPRVFYNLINDIAEIVKPDYEEIGKEFIE